MKTPTTDDAVEELSFREASLPPSLQELRQKLGQKAKQQKRYPRVTFGSLNHFVRRCRRRCDRDVAGEVRGPGTR